MKKKSMVLYGIMSNRKPFFCSFMLPFLSLACFVLLV